MQNTTLSTTEGIFSCKRITHLLNYDKAIFFKPFLSLSLLCILCGLLPEFLKLLFSSEEFIEFHINPAPKLVFSFIAFFMFTFFAIHNKVNHLRTPFYIQIPGTVLEKYLILVAEAIFMFFWSYLIGQISYFLSLLLFSPENVFVVFHWINFDYIFGYEDSTDHTLSFVALVLMFISIIGIFFFCAITYKKGLTAMLLSGAYSLFYIIFVAFILIQFIGSWNEVLAVIIPCIVTFIAVIVTIATLVGAYINLKHKSFR